jgi:hypothetical protein
MQLSKVLHRQLCLFELPQQGFHPFQNTHHALCGMNPTPHAGIPMMPNNILKAKHTNKGCLTCGICCTWAWNSSHFNFIFFSLNQGPFFHSTFALHPGCSKYEHSWNRDLVV